jgi:regulator of protease activity HflC (stomatin/prohibitin superfamily)
MMTAAQATKNRPGVPLWARIGYALFGALLTLIAYRVGSIWAGHAVIILLTFVAVWFSKPEARRVVLAAQIMFSLTLLLATAFIEFFNAPEQVAAIEGSGFLRFLLGGTAVRVLVSILAALALSVVLVAMPVLIVAYASSEWILAMREVYGVTRRQALRLLLSTIFQTSYAYYIVEDGEITKSKPDGLLPQLGGPGIVIIKPYNAVVFERSGEVTRIVGPGKVLTKRFEFAKEIIDLCKQSTPFTCENVLTKDHVPLTFHCSVNFRIEAAKDTAKWLKSPVSSDQGGQFPGVISGDYKVYQHTLYRAVYQTGSSGWKGTTKGASETQLLNVVREYPLADLYRLQSGRLIRKQSAIDQIRQEVLHRVSDLATQWGVTVTGFKIASFEAPAEVKEGLLELWAAPYEKVRTRIEAEAVRKRIESRGQAEAQAIAHIERVKSHAREELIHLLQTTLLDGYPGPYSMELISRFLTAIESLSRALGTDTATATRYIEALEKMATESGTKVLIVGEERRLLPPLLDAASGPVDTDPAGHR